MAEVNWTDEAEEWLLDIHDFIAQDNPAAAAAWEAIGDRAAEFSEYRASGPVR